MQTPLTINGELFGEAVALAKPGMEPSAVLLRNECMTERSYAPLDVAGRDAHVVYLDFDGVLHPELVYMHPDKGPFLDPSIMGHKLFEHSQLLVDLLRPYPDVRVVLSTSWVVVRGFGRARKHLPPELRTRVIGATFHSSMNPFEWGQMPRGYQILSDARRRLPSQWVAVDDDVENWPAAHKERLIKSHGMNGLSHPGVADALRQRLFEWYQNAKN